MSSDPDEPSNKSVKELSSIFGKRVTANKGAPAAYVAKLHAANASAGSSGDLPKITRRSSGPVVSTEGLIRHPSGGFASPQSYDGNASEPRDFKDDIKGDVKQEAKGPAPGRLGLRPIGSSAAKGPRPSSGDSAKGPSSSSSSSSSFLPQVKLRHTTAGSSAGNKDSVAGGKNVSVGVKDSPPVGGSSGSVRDGTKESPRDSRTKAKSRAGAEPEPLGLPSPGSSAKAAAAKSSPTQRSFSPGGNYTRDEIRKVVPAWIMHLAALKARHMEKVSRLKVVEEEIVISEQRNKSLQTRHMEKVSRLKVEEEEIVISEQRNKSLQARHLEREQRNKSLQVSAEEGGPGFVLGACKARVEMRVRHV
ncbi:unnamed protein product [Closterium sp. NIES-54]